jgi:hypothetical protein
MTQVFKNIVNGVRQTPKPNEINAIEVLIKSEIKLGRFYLRKNLNREFLGLSPNHLNLWPNLSNEK